MSRFNKIILIGNVHNEPSTTTVSSGDSKTAFKLEVSRPETENSKNQSDIFSIVSWRDLANTAAGLSIGNQVLIEGSIQNRNFENNEGQRIYITEIEARQLKVLTNQSTSNPTPQEEFMPVIEEQQQENNDNFDFNDAIKATENEPAPFENELGEDVPF